LKIAIGAKRLLLSDEIKDEPNMPETEELAALIECYEDERSEIFPQLKPYKKKLGMLI